MALLTQDRYEQLVKYLREGSYPPSLTSNQKRGLRQQAANFLEKDGILFHHSKDSTADVKILRRVVFDEEEKNRIIRACQ